MAKEMDTKKVEELLEKKNEEAKKLLGNKEKTENTLKEVNEKLNKLDFKPLTNMMSDIKTITSLVKDFSSGRYRALPKRSIIALMGALIYFLSPIDIIPDVLPFAGLIDDTFVMSLILKQFKTDLDVYKAWKTPKEGIIEEYKRQYEEKHANE